MTYTGSVRFDWDPARDWVNQKKHGISFEEAKELFTSDDCLEIYDEEHSAEEDRFIAIGAIRAGVLVVVFTQRQEDVIRILSARRATKQEAHLLHQYLV